ncbi:MAG: ATP-dependent Clp protease proteolytic subunit [Terrisporobacter othiniensis]|uniref:ATP-dependent Clp protease proteolytic subunit n=1 Tax=Terrisporobacter hibernicus TaxID=2813371 RepID=A0AAX2ZH41_9FIRM|nr:MULTISPECIES: ATP-dependent Clp protease proteolytic subunit [Terrisporobacter]MDU4860268.1 ATP-dependent Clp protease proteolytic subunit [Terrisporobacter othiniensis]UPA31319.1 ATP-dependent Clp protease proteolytic subunit [Terrisporobacter glycolicus]MDU6996906.1 ATP-dependent Clp protease proteolytic subunit [Terrisporobacter othiniensis]UEL48653.1 ATP-dependent Clp protease proteolytic subunit [Terrisporobacter hibernicus]HBI93234.1 ATP-dependent Clp protease proteolytic subunit [Ter
MIYLGEKEEKGKDTSNVVMEKLLKSRTIFISGEINQELAEKVATQLLILQEMGDEPIKIFINSQGGHVEAGDTIHDMIKFVKPKVIVIGTGWVASAGITIYLAADKENRYSLPNTRYMIHQPLGQCRGQATDLHIEALEIARVRERINKIISNATNQPLEKVKNDTDRNYWLNCEEAVEYGIVNKVISSYQEIPTA